MVYRKRVFLFFIFALYSLGGFGLNCLDPLWLMVCQNLKKSNVSGFFLLGVVLKFERIINARKNKTPVGALILM